MISSSGEAAEKKSNVMGRYHKLEEKHNDLPIWKKEGGSPYHIVYNKKYNKWVVDTAPFEETKVFLKMPSSRDYLPLKVIPRFGWQYHDGEWKDDKTLVISPGEESNQIYDSGERKIRCWIQFYQQRPH